MSTEDLGVPRPRKRSLPRWLKTVLVFLGVFLFLVVGAWILVDITTRQDLEAAIASWRAHGWPTDVGEIYPQPIPDSENAALVYQQAYDRISLTDEQDYLLASVGTVAEWRALSEADQGMFRDAITRNSEALRLLRQAAQMSDCQFDVDYGSVEDALSAMYVGPLLARPITESLMRARVILDGAEGRGEEAFQWWLGLLTMGRHRGWPVVPLQLLETLVQEGVFTKPQLAQALRALEGIDVRKDLIEHLRKQLAIARSVMVQREAVQEYVADVFGSPLPSLFFKAYYSPIGRPWRQYDQTAFITLLEAGIEASEKPFHKGRAELGEWEERLQTYRLVFGAPITFWMQCAWPSRAKGVAHMQARLTLARTALALERYRVSRDEYPQSLDVLAPEYLLRVPPDPFTGTPLGYIRSAERVAVYSVGPDLQDGGGAEREAGSSEWDIVFTLRRAPGGAPEETGNE